MTRRLILLTAVAGVVLMWAGPAQAKGPWFHGTTSGTVKISGPKMRVPLVLGWKGDCGLFSPCSDITALDSDFLALARDTMLGAVVPDYARTYYPVPSKSQLGPAYDVQWTLVRSEGRQLVIHQTLYPFAQGRPWVFLPSGQNLPDLPFQTDPISTPPSLSVLLHSYGFPTKAEVVGPTTAAVTAAEKSSSASRPWIWVLAIAAMSLLLIGGALTGRRRAAVRAA
jgi:hypothetical protein